MKTLGERRLHREVLLVMGMAAGLSACGGGGGNVRPTPAAPTPAPAPAPTPAPAPAPPPAPPIDAQLTITNANAAHAQGFDGTGVVIGVVDSGIMESNPALAGRVSKELIYVDPTQNNTAIDDVVGHGTWVSEIAAGKPFDEFTGGIAPGATLVSARIISDTEPTDDGSGQGNQVTSADPLGAINGDLIANNVKVMNNSWGGLYWSASATATTQSFDDAYSPFINTWGGLVVFAAGNDSAANPSDTAALPSRAPDLAKGWLTVVAVDSNNPTKLASYSNACGIAMNYCLAAPGDVIVLDKDTTASTTNPTYYIVQGTSLAAPQVSGAAALVWQAYPYFNNDLVRQTLLGTADDLGTPGVDSTFGYGELDVGKAVNGPEQFNWGDVTVSFTGNSSWNNPISGAGGLIKQGTGTLNLTQPSTYTGDTNVQGGTLAAKALAGNLIVGAQGAVALSGGDTTVAGNYTQQGRLAVSLGSVLRVAGTATISGDLYVTGKNSGYVANSHTDVLDTAGGLTGTFSNANNIPGFPSNVMLNATIEYDANNAWLNVQQVQVTAIQGATYTAASYGAAQRVQGAFEQINSQLGAAGAASGQPVAASFMVGAAKLQQSPSVAAAQQSLESLSGQLRAASTAMAFEAIDAGTRALSDRFDTLLDRPLAGGWVQNLGYHGGMSRSGYSNVGYDLSGTMVGEDQRIGSNGYAGYALSQSNGLGRLAESADQGRSHALEGMLYGGVINGSWYTMGRFGVGDYRENIRRFVQLGNQEAGVGSDNNGRYSVAYGESGYRMELGRTQITPYLDLQYAQIQRDGFDEQGADGFGLKAGAQTAARWQAGLGLRATRKWPFAGGGSLSLQTRLLWQQSFGMRGEVFDASFSGFNQFAPLGGVGLARYGGVIGSTLNWSMSPRASLQIGYDEYLGQGQESKMGTANFSWAF